MCVISIIRIFTLKSGTTTTDVSWDITGVACWSVIELNCGIICSSLPILRPLLARCIPGLGSGLRTNSNYRRNASGHVEVEVALEGSKRRGKVGDASSSTEQLAMSPVADRKASTGVFAECLADGRSEEESFEMGSQSWDRNQNRIIVTTETMFDEATMRKQ